jgi:6-phosphogluconolactonase
MSFLRAARAALTGPACLRRLLPSVMFVIVILLAGLLLSCGSGRYSRDHNAYVTLPGTGNVLLLYINGVNGIITLGPATPQVLDATTIGLALAPSKKFLYTVNSFADTISIFSIVSDGTLSLTATPTQESGSGPYDAVIDPSGKYLLVTNNLSASVSVFSIDPTTGALTPTHGSPFFANADPAEILFIPSTNIVYVSNPGIGTVTIFSFSSGVLTQLYGLSPVISGAGATGLAVDASGQFLYVANPSAINPPPYSTTTGNISAFNINQTTGALTPVPGSPFTAIGGSGPTELTVDPSGTYLYASTPGTGDSIWCFIINSTTGQLTPASNSPFSVAAGAAFAVFDPTGSFFYIGNSSGKAIDGYTYNSSTGGITAIPGSPFNIGAAPGKIVFTE